MRYNVVSHNPAIASWSAVKLAQAVYERSPAERKAQIKRLGGGEQYVGADAIDQGGVQIGIGWATGHVVIAFAGSNDREDVIADLDARRRPFLAGSVHGGGLKQFERVYPWIGERSLIGKRVVIVGHSLGALLGGLLASQLHNHGVFVSAAHFFGSPRWCDREFATWYDEELGRRTWRYVHCADLVTRLPPPAPEWAMRTIHRMRLVGLAKRIVGYPAEYEVGDYRHLGRTVYLDSAGRVVRDAPMRSVISDRVLGRFSSPVRGVSDHSLNWYASILTTHAKRAVRAGGE